MKVERRDSGLADLLVEEGPERSGGIHVSTLIRAICQQLEPERFTDDPIDPVHREMGFSVERMIERAWETRRLGIFRPGELEKDGIVGSPDAITVDDHGLIVDEIKCTWMSSRDCPEGKKFWHWLVQIKAYCWLIETYRARLHVFFVNGDYRDQRGPQYQSWDLTFSQGELAETWLMLVNQAKALSDQARAVQP
jgi:hypothetical protein